MKDPESRIIFAGVDGRIDTELAEWYRQRHRGDDLVSFAEANGGTQTFEEVLFTDETETPVNVLTGKTLAHSRARLDEAKA